MEHTLYENIRAFLLETYKKANIPNLQIVALMGAIEYEINKIVTKGLFSKRFNVSKNIRVVVYKNHEIALFVNVRGIVKVSKQFSKKEIINSRRSVR